MALKFRGLADASVPSVRSSGFVVVVQWFVRGLVVWLVGGIVQQTGRLKVGFGVSAFKISLRLVNGTETKVPT